MFESLPEGVFVDDDGNVSVYVNKDRVQPVALCPQPECPLPTDDVAQPPVSSSHSSMANASRTRKRKREPQKWKGNESKRKRNSGDAYVDRHGKSLSLQKKLLSVANSRSLSENFFIFLGERKL